MPFDAPLLASLELNPFSSKEAIAQRFLEELTITSDSLKKNELSAFRDTLLTELDTEADLIGLIKTPEDLNKVLASYSIEMIFCVLDSLNGKEYVGSFFAELRAQTTNFELAATAVATRFNIFAFVGFVAAKAVQTALTDSSPQSVLEKIVAGGKALQIILNDLPENNTRAVLMYLRMLPKFQELAEQILAQHKNTGSLRSMVLDATVDRRIVKALPESIQPTANTVISSLFDMPKNQLRLVSDGLILNRIEDHDLKRLFFFLEYCDCYDTTRGNPEELHYAFKRVETEIYPLIAAEYLKIVATHQDPEQYSDFRQWLDSELPTSLHVHLCNASAGSAAQSRDRFAIMDHVAPALLHDIGMQREPLFLCNTTPQTEPEPAPALLDDSPLSDLVNKVIELLDTLTSHVYAKKGNHLDNQKLVEDKTRFLTKIKIALNNEHNSEKDILGLLHLAQYVAMIETNIANRATHSISSSVDRKTGAKLTNTYSSVCLTKLYAEQGLSFTQDDVCVERQKKIIHCLGRHMSPRAVVALFKLDSSTPIITDIQDAKVSSTPVSTQVAFVHNMYSTLYQALSNLQREVERARILEHAWSGACRFFRRYGMQPNLLLIRNEPEPDSSDNTSLSNPTNGS